LRAPAPRHAADKCLARLIDSAYIGAVGRIDPASLAEFEAAARRPLAVRWRYSFIRTCKPVLDDAEFRSFDTMEEYRLRQQTGSA